MYSTNEALLEKFNSPVRSIVARVELYNGSTLIQTFRHDGDLMSVSVERVCEENKFFGFGICQKITVKIRDKYRQIEVAKGQAIKVYFEEVAPYPVFYVTEVVRDENNNNLTVTAYDALKDSSSYTVSELVFINTLDDEPTTNSYTLAQFVEACAAILGLSTRYVNLQGDLSFQTHYIEGANFEGTELVRDALTAAAEATQTIFYISDNDLVFKRLDRDGPAALSIDKSIYFTLDSKTNRVLNAICSVTELGDNVEARLEEVEGVTQYIRDNPFLANREDLAQLLDNALTAVGGFVINQFDCKWRGNPLLELGDKIALTTKDNDIVTSYVFNDAIEYNGGVVQKTSCAFSDIESETATNPTNLGEVIKQTYAKVDKVNKTVELVASEVSGNSQAISNIKITTDDITNSVKAIEGQYDEVTNELQLLTEEVSSKMTKDELVIEVKSQLESGINKVITTTGFTFDGDGLTVSRSGSEMSTRITEDGMTVSRDNTEVLIADNEGVKAEDLHATTYLIVGGYSRFEDFGNRTGCFWIG